MKDKKIFLIIFSVAFILNAIWELLHYRLYYDLSGIPQYPHLLLATITDALIITAIFLVISLRNKNPSWIKKPRKSDYFIIILLGLFIAAFIETRALTIGRWAYKEAMPTILWIGMSPLLQLATTSVLTLVIIRIFRFRSI